MFEKYVCAKCNRGEGILRCTCIEGQGIVDVNHDTQLNFLHSYWYSNAFCLWKFMALSNSGSLLQIDCIPCETAFRAGT